MDSLYWKNLIPEINIEYSRQLFFKRYLYKLEILAYGGQSIKTAGTISDSLRLRSKSYRLINHGGSWQARMAKEISLADDQWLEYLQNYRNSLHEDIKLRIEEPNIQLYSSNLSLLKDFAENLPRQFLDYIVTFTGPKNNEEEKLITSGKKILKKSPKYRFKIFFRDGKYSLSTKQSVLSYLDSLEDLIVVPEHCRKEFSKNYSSTWDCYICSKM